MTERKRVGIVGGSIAGCAAAVGLSRSGHDVTIFERSATGLMSRGAGIGTFGSVLEAVIARGLLDQDFPRLASSIRYVCSDGERPGERWLGDVPTPILYALNWAQLFEQLRSRVPHEVYRAGVSVDSLETAGSEAIVHTSTGTSETFDLVVAADGYHSVGRALVAPEVQLSYRGMVLWRGLLDEGELEADRLAGHMTRVLYRGGHGMAYITPGRDGSTEPGHRLAGWGYYIQVPQHELESILVDDEGREQAGSVPFGRVPAEIGASLRDRVKGLIPEYYSDLIDRATTSAIQAIYSVRVPRYVRGRVCLVGDAGSVLPPFTGSGVLKAMTNVTTLADALLASGPTEVSLSAWSGEQEETVATLMPLAERIEQDLVFNAPDVASMTNGDVGAWLTRLHPHVELILPES